MNEVDQQSPLEQMIREQVIERGITDERVLNAMRAVRRDRFFPDEIREEAYEDRAAPVGHGQTISQPYIVALMTEKLCVGPADRVLEVGTGTGYHTAILAKLAGEVFSVERVKPLLDAAFERLMDMNIRNVHFRFGDGTLGWPDASAAPFDRILIGAGAPGLPRELLLHQLKDDGLAVLPIGPHDSQMLVAARRRGDKLDVEQIAPVRFVKLVGKEGWSE